MKDLLKYARFHLGDGTAEDGSRLLSAEGLAAMREPHVTVWGDAAWGLSWGIEPVGDVFCAQHGGGTVGQVSRLTVVPERDFAVAILTNAGSGNRVIKPVRRQALQDWLGLEPDEPAAIEATEDDLRQYVGRYSRPFDEIELGLLGGRLVGQVTTKGGFPTKDSPVPPAPGPRGPSRSRCARRIACL